MDEFNGSSWKVRKKLAQIKKLVSQENATVKDKYKKKINHYKKTMERLYKGNQRDYNSPVGMDGMNKAQDRGGQNIRAVDMDGMNKDPSGGG